MYLLFDIGGTNTRIATSIDGQSLENIEMFSTPKEFEEGMARFKKYVDRVGHNLESVSGGFPGTYDTEKKIILRAPNLGGWTNARLHSVVSQITGAKVYLENDAHLAGLGEAVKGEGKEFNIVAYITISTGIGGVRIVAKNIDKAAVGFEPGHQVVVVNRPGEANVNISYLEELVSGKNIKLRYGKEPEDIDDPLVWDEVHRFLAIGLNNTIVHWSPDIVIIGGGLGLSDKISVEKLENNLSNYLDIFNKPPAIKKGVLAETAALEGALYYIKSMESKA